MSAPTTAKPQPFTTANLVPAGWPARAFVAAGLDRLFGLRPLARAYDRLPACGGFEFSDHALAALGVSLRVEGTARVPQSGGLLVVANHPTGALDGLALIKSIGRIRSDVRVLGNLLLSVIPNFRDILIAVDPFSRSPERVRSNVSALRAAGRWLEGGGCLLTFPSGEVAHRVRSDGVAIDDDWHAHIATLAVRSGAAALPVLIRGCNSLMFRGAGLLHPLLRTAMLPRELWRHRNRTVEIVVGEPIAADTIERIPEIDRASYLKARTYLLAGSPSPRCRVPTAAVPTKKRPSEIVDAVDSRDVAADIAALPAGRLLVESGTMRVYCAPAGELPSVLREIGRLRELTFRAVGEGTGHAIDLDRFDGHYWHLFAWDSARAAIVGAYRLGPTDEIVATHGPNGLYTRTLFHYDTRLLDEIGAAIELGRSFIREEYQRGFTPLLLLWKGIGRFIALRPHYRSVFGAVSISNRYESLSRLLLVRFLSGAALHPRAARLVRPRRPIRPLSSRESLVDVVTVNSLEAVSDIVGTIENDGKAIPVLLRQYLNLNARLLGFSVDPEFGDALDGLMLADLTQVPPAMLERLMGKDAARQFRAYHAETSSSGEAGTIGTAVRRVRRLLTGVSTS